MGSKEPPSNFRGTLGSHYHSRLHFMAWITKNTLLSFKRQKRTKCRIPQSLRPTHLLKDRLASAQKILRLIWISNHFIQMSDWELFGSIRKHKKLFIKKLNIYLILNLFVQAVPNSDMVATYLLRIQKCFYKPNVHLWLRLWSSVYVGSNRISAIDTIETLRNKFYSNSSINRAVITRNLE